MNLRYASVILLLSSVLIALAWLLCADRAPVTATSQEDRLNIVVAAPPLAAALNDFLDPRTVRIETLLHPGADVHHMHFTPSQLRRAAAADIAVLPMLEDGFDAGEDPHIWLDQHLFTDFITRIAKQLDEENRAAANHILALRADWLAQERQRFAPFADAPFITDHDAFKGLEADLGLTGKLGALTTGHGQAIGAKSLRALRAKAAGKKVCVLHGQQANTQRITTMLDGIDIALTEADPMLWNDPSYLNGLRRLVNAFYQCLSAPQLSEATP